MPEIIVEFPVTRPTLFYGADHKDSDRKNPKYCHIVALPKYLGTNPVFQKYKIMLGNKQKKTFCDQLTPQFFSSNRKHDFFLTLSNYYKISISFEFTLSIFPWLICMFDQYSDTPYLCKSTRRWSLFHKLFILHILELHCIRVYHTIPRVSCGIARWRVFHCTEHLIFTNLIVLHLRKPS